MDNSHPGYVEAPESWVSRVGIFLLDSGMMYGWAASIGDGARVSSNPPGRPDDIC
jgi:hypothetical protein